MRRLIALVIIGLGIAMAIYHLRKRESRSNHKNVEAPASRTRWKKDDMILSFPMPALLVTFIVNGLQQHGVIQHE